MNEFETKSADCIRNGAGVWVRDDAGKWYFKSPIVSGVQGHLVGYEYIDPITGEKAGWWKKQALKRKVKLMYKKEKEIRQAEIRKSNLADLRQHIPE